MANTPVAQHVLTHKGGGNAKVFPLLAGSNLGGQDGSDLGTGGPGLATQEVPHLGTLAMDRVAEFLNDRYALASGWVYKKGQGGAGQWGRVMGGGVAEIVDGRTTGLYVMHPNGIPTLVFLLFDAAHELRLFKTEDGATGTDWATAVGTVIETNGASPGRGTGQSLAFKTTIYWVHSRYGGGAGAGYLTAYDLVTGLITRWEFTLTSAFNSGSNFGLHNHLGIIVIAGAGLGITSASNTCGVTKLAGGLLSKMTNTISVTQLATTNHHGHTAMLTDPTTGDLICFWTGSRSGGNPRTLVTRLQNVASGSQTETDISSVVLGAVEGGNRYLEGAGSAALTRRWSVFVDTVTDPTSPKTFLTTWDIGGSSETWEWIGVASEIHLINLGAGVSDNNAFPYALSGGGHRSPSTARISIGDVANPPVEVFGGTKMFFRAAGFDTANTLQFRGTDTQGAPDTIVPIAAASLVVVTKPLLEDSLEAYWKLNDDYLDSSGNNLDLFPVGAVPFAAGKFNNGADFPGSAVTDFLRRNPNDDPSLDIGILNAPYAVAAWFKIDAFATISAIATKANGSTQGWSLRVLTSGAVDWRVMAAPNTLVTAAALITTGVFHHVVVNSDGTTVKIYIDGVEQASKSADANLDQNTPFTLGNKATANEALNGVIDEVAIWSRALTLGEIGFVYNAGAGFELEGATPWSAGQPSISGNTIINLTPDESKTLYSVVLDTGAAGIDEGETGLLIAEIL